MRTAYVTNRTPESVNPSRAYGKKHKLMTASHVTSVTPTVFTRHGLSGTPFQLRPITVPKSTSGKEMNAHMKKITTTA